MLTREIESRALELLGSAICNWLSREQARSCVQRPPQPISNQDPCSPAWFCI
ncbi:unnamed protein product [Hymenolepis diminuta]|uniref:Uncharacterized protein n=1 Tax=Hymenolepis diminuta TaxID=6216 RepID=A0A564XZ04_HYMDI|nr:unnamed protein product [Hymenolepis diminuta]